MTHTKPLDPNDSALISVAVVSIASWFVLLPIALIPPRWLQGTSMVSVNSVGWITGVEIWAYEPKSLITGNKDGCLCSGGKHISSKPIQEHVLLSRKRHCVCVPRLFSLKMIVSDKEQPVPTSEDTKEYETYGECSPYRNHQHLDNTIRIEYIEYRLGLGTEIQEP